MPPPRKERSLPLPVADFLHSFPDDHPLQIALRTYALALSFALGPALLPILTSGKAWSKTGTRRVRGVLRREMGVQGFAFVMMVCVGGGATIKHLWDIFDGENGKGDSVLPVHAASRPPQARKRSWFSLGSSHKTFISNVISASVAFALLHAKLPTSLRSPLKRSPPLPPSVPAPVIIEGLGKASPTLDLTLLLVVRAVDSVLQKNILGSAAVGKPGLSQKDKEEKKKKRQQLKVALDALIFWACSARYEFFLRLNRMNIFL